MAPTLESFVYFLAIYSSRPRLGCVHWKEIYENHTKTGFLLSSDVDLVLPLNWNSKIDRFPRTNFEKVLFKFCFLDHYQKPKEIQNQAIRIEAKTIYPKLWNETPLFKTSSVQETAHKIWLILKPKTYCFPPSSTGQTRPTPLGLRRQNPAKNSNTWKTFQEEAYFAKTKLNLHILSFRTDRLPRRRLRFTEVPKSRPNPPCKNLQDVLCSSSSREYFSLHNFEPRTSFAHRKRGGRFKVEKLVQIILA